LLQPIHPYDEVKMFQRDDLDIRSEAILIHRPDAIGNVGITL
jgi:hypothetical protein